MKGIHCTLMKKAKAKAPFNRLIRTLGVIALSVFFFQAHAQEDVFIPDSVTIQFGEGITYRFWDDLSFQFTEHPAYTGYGYSEAMVRYTSLWPSESFGDHRFTAAGETSLLQKGNRCIASIGLSAQLSIDPAIPFQKYQLTLAYHPIRKDQHSLSIGADMAYAGWKVDAGALSFGDMIDPRKGFIYNTQETGIDNNAAALLPGVGIWHRYKGWYTAATWKTMHSPETARLASTGNNLWLFSTGYYYLLPGDFLLKAGLDVQMDELQTVWNPSLTSIVDGNFIFGMTLRNLNQTMATIGYQHDMKWRILFNGGLPATPLMSEIGTMSYMQVQFKYNFL